MLRQGGSPETDLNLDGRFDPYRLQRKVWSPPVPVRLVQGEITNESVPGIVSALRPTRDHRVLSIAGTGCIPIALAWEGAIVDAWDTSDKALALTQERIGLIASGRVKDFVEIGTIEHPLVSIARYQHFNRLRQPEASLKISCFEGNIEVAVGETKYDRAWLSNSFSYGKDAPEVGFLVGICRLLAPGALVYFADGDKVHNVLQRHRSELPLQEVSDLTRTANFYERQCSDFGLVKWQPVVTRYVGGAQ